MTTPMTIATARPEGFDVTCWVALFREAGLTDDQMDRWHQEFERLHPQAHQSFLEWLGLPAERIAEIRR